MLFDSSFIGSALGGLACFGVIVFCVLAVWGWDRARGREGHDENE